MQLDPGERAMTIPFHHMEQAKDCREALLAAGLTDVRVDRVGEFHFEPRVTPLGQGKSTSQDEVFTDSPLDNLGDSSARILTAATPAVSGMSGPLTSSPGIVLTVVLPTERSAEVERIARAHGAAM